jgi:hypothetical protein
VPRSLSPAGTRRMGLHTMVNGNVRAGHASFHSSAPGPSPASTPQNTMANPQHGRPAQHTLNTNVCQLPTTNQTRNQVKVGNLKTCQ